MSFEADLLRLSRIVREPVSHGEGYWAGAPGAFHEPTEKAWYLTYRIRRPRGVEPDRGGETHILRSTDLRDWEDVWTAKRSELKTASIERCALRKSEDGIWRNFVSFVDPADGRWCVSVIEAHNLKDLSASEAKPLFKARDFGLEGVKDPWICDVGGTFHMLLSVALPTASTTSASHSTLDIYNTGECVSATALATSTDLRKWDWRGVVLAPAGSGWDQYCRRINSILPLGRRFIGFYDGSASHRENYEERTGIAVSENLREWKVRTPRGPVLISPHATGSLRYIDAQTAGDNAIVFFELARADKAHEMRVASFPIKSLESWLREIETQA
jgi:hypothetical protein